MMGVTPCCMGGYSVVHVHSIPRVLKKHKKVRFFFSETECGSVRFLVIIIAFLISHHEHSFFIHSQFRFEWIRLYSPLNNKVPSVRKYEVVLV